MSAAQSLRQALRRKDWSDDDDDADSSSPDGAATSTNGSSDGGSLRAAARPPAGGQPTMRSVGTNLKSLHAQGALRGLNAAPRGGGGAEATGAGASTGSTQQQQQRLQFVGHPTWSSTPPPAVGRAAMSPSSSAVHTLPAASAAEYEAEAVWEAKLASITQRIAAKETVMEQRDSQRITRAADEVATVQARHIAEEKLEIRRQQEEEEERRLKAEAEAEHRRVYAYEIYIAESTAKLSPRSKTQWLADEAELKRLEEAMQATASSMGSRQRHINGLIDVYDAKMARLDAAQRQEEEDRREAELAFHRAMAGQRLALEAEDAVFRLLQTHEADAVAFEMFGQWLVEHVAVETAVRQRFVRQMTPAQFDAFFALPSDEAREQAVVELIALDVLKSRVRRSIGSKSATS